MHVVHLDIHALVVDVDPAVDSALLADAAAAGADRASLRKPGLGATSLGSRRRDAAACARHFVFSRADGFIRRPRPPADGDRFAESGRHRHPCLRRFGQYGG